MSDSSSLIGEWFGNPKRRKRSERRQAIPKPLVLSTKITPCFNKVCRILRETIAPGPEYD